MEPTSEIKAVHVVFLGKETGPEILAKFTLVDGKVQAEYFSDEIRDMIVDGLPVYMEGKQVRVFQQDGLQFLKAVLMTFHGAYTRAVVPETGG